MVIEARAHKKGLACVCVCWGEGGGGSGNQPPDRYTHTHTHLKRVQEAKSAVLCGIEKM